MPFLGDNNRTGKANAAASQTGSGGRTSKETQKLNQLVRGVVIITRPKMHSVHGTLSKSRRKFPKMQLLQGYRSTPSIGLAVKQIRISIMFPSRRIWKESSYTEDISYLRS